MGRKRKRKNRNTKNNSERNDAKPECSPAEGPAAAPVVARTTQSEFELRRQLPHDVPLETPWEQWPALWDWGLTPIRFPYGPGGVPLFLLVVYLSFLAMSSNYMTRWLLPDFMTYFGK